ncbi:MAG: prenyltransferase [Syntrophobacterales bacterium]|nr:prenyltransferase [Syntrophobacterales bacterium]
MRLGVYLKAMRLPFLTGSLMPVAAAAALAYLHQGTLNGRHLLLTALGVAALHTGGNLINDYYDSFGSDPLNPFESPYSGGSRVIVRGELSAAAVRHLAYGFLALGALCGLILIGAGRPHVAGVGLAGLLFAYLYSAAPVQLMSLGLGELTIFLAFGPVLTLGTYYVLTGAFAGVGLAVGLPLAFLITAILWINEFPDLEADLAAAKRHLMSRVGLRAARWVYGGLMLAPFVSLLLLIEVWGLPPHLLACLVALPGALRASRLAFSLDPRQEEFIGLQALTIRTHFLFGLSQTLALLYAAWRG